MDTDELVSAFITINDLDAVVIVAGKQINGLVMVATTNQLERQTSHPPKKGPSPDKVEALAEKDPTLKKRKLDDEASSTKRNPPKRAKKRAQQSPLKDIPGNIIPRCYRYAAHSYSPGSERRHSPDSKRQNGGGRGRTRTGWPATATFQVLEKHESDEKRHAEQSAGTASSSFIQDAALKAKRTGTTLKAAKQEQPKILESLQHYCNN